MPLAPALIMFSIAVTWPSLSPSLAPAPVSSLAPSFGGLGLRAFLHLHEEGVGLGLGDQADDDLARGRAGTGGRGGWGRGAGATGGEDEGKCEGNGRCVLAEHLVPFFVERILWDYPSRNLAQRR